MNLPPFVKAKAFWEFVSLILAGVLGLLSFFAVIPAEWAVGSGVILAGVLSLLRLFGVEAELKLRGFKVEGFMGLKSPAKKAKK